MGCAGKVTAPPVVIPPVVIPPENDYQIVVISDNSPNGNVDMSIEIVGVEGSCKVYRDEVLISSGDYALGDDSVYIPLSDLGGKTVGINIFVDKAESLKVNSDWTSDSEDSGRVIDVNNFVEGVSNINFAVWSVHLNVPNTLPTSVTSLKNMFESCINFNSDLSDWNTSNVTSMENTFSGCEFFESDLSSWDVSKVESFRYTFSGARSFNSDLSGWDTSSATDMFRMFSVAKSFTSIVENWNVSNVLDMDYMFQPLAGDLPSLPAQDLSRWCVTNIESPPMDFISYDWTGNLPIWGTCPERV